MFKKFSQPSTWAGVGVAAMVAGPYIEKAAHSATWPAVAVALLSAVIAIIKDETGTK